MQVMHAITPKALPDSLNLLNFDKAALAAYLHELGESKPLARAEDILRYLHAENQLDISQWQKISLQLRELLQREHHCQLPVIRQTHHSNDGTIKWLLGIAGGQSIETVFIPEGERGTLCVSSQVGCALNCQFCSTATQGFNRNLSTAEIIGQVLLAKQQLAASAQQITNIVMMGMGEPLLNYSAVLSAMRIMLDDHAYNLSKYRVTLSTSGVVPKIWQLTDDIDVALAISLHAPNNALRDQLVPINRKYPLMELLAACRYYGETYPKRSITIEYVMLDNVNDSLTDAAALAEVLKGLAVKINLIPFNPYPGACYQCSSDSQIHQFQHYLIEQGFNTIIRRTRGADIAAACGQLVGKVLDRSRRSQQNKLTGVDGS